MLCLACMDDQSLQVQQSPPTQPSPNTKVILESIVGLGHGNLGWISYKKVRAVLYQDRIECYDKKTGESILVIPLNKISKIGGKALFRGNSLSISSEGKKYTLSFMDFVAVSGIIGSAIASGKAAIWSDTLKQLGVR
jgi:hypothetical protein